MSTKIKQFDYSARQYPNQVSILWFNKESHVELALDGKMYSLCLGMFEKIRSVEDQRKRSVKNKGAEYYQFDFALTKSEYLSLSNALTKKQRPNCDYCSGSIARYISKYTDIKIPFLAGRSPTLLANCLFRNPQDYKIKRISGIGSQKNIEKEFGSACLKDCYLFSMVFGITTLCLLGLAVFFLVLNEDDA